MKWIDLNSKTGDITSTPYSETDFCGKRLPKSHEIFDFLGALDYANAIIGNHFRNNSTSSYLQSINRDIMGFVYTGKKAKELSATLDLIEEDFIGILEFLDETGSPPSGWTDYNSPYDLLCCQIRHAERAWGKVDRQFLSDRSRFSDEDYSLVANFLNRLSKYYYVKGMYHGSDC